MNAAKSGKTFAVAGICFFVLAVVALVGRFTFGDRVVGHIGIVGYDARLLCAIGFSVFLSFALLSSILARVSGLMICEARGGKYF